jgi:hypothetical protein
MDFPLHPLRNIRSLQHAVCELIQAQTDRLENAIRVLIEAQTGLKLEVKTSLVSR